jgi:DNA mismatch repair protein MutS2
MIADATTAERIGLDWLRDAVAPVGAFGRRHDELIAPYGPGDETAAQAEIAEVVALAEQLKPDEVGRVRAALRAVPEPGPIVARARVGDRLDDVDFYELGRFADAVDALRRAWDAAGGDGSRRPPPLHSLQSALAPGREGAGFYLADAFAPGLRAARAVLADAEAAYDREREWIAAGVRDVLGIDPAGDEFVVLRDAYDGPLPGDVRIVRETPTYRVLAFAIVSPERDAAFAALAEEEEAARRVLAERIAHEAESITEVTRTLGALDRLLARVSFAQRWGGCIPELRAGGIAFAGATFAPLADALAARGHRYTPLSLALAGVAVLTGPNMGGKSAALATVGFVCACVALGVAPPATSASLPLLETVGWLGGDGPGERTRLLSSYAAEIVRARDALATASPRVLVMIDEFARTTGPREGRALLIALAEALRDRGALALCTTHFGGVAEAAGVEHLRIAGLRQQSIAAIDGTDLDAALDAINAAMDYRVVDARTGNPASDALALAALLGLDAELVERARILYDGG